jgi:ribosome-interacting GTPase 1
MIKFDYEHPEELLERLGIELNKKEVQGHILYKNQEIIDIDNNKSKIKLTKELVGDYFKDKRLEDMKMLTAKQRLEIKI